MIYVISKETCGSYGVRDIQSNSAWCECPYSDYALIPDHLVDGILATHGYCDIVLNDAGTVVSSFTAREIPEVPSECCGKRTVLSVDGIDADEYGDVSLTHKQNKLDWITDEDIDAMFAGTYVGAEDEYPAEVDAVLLAVQEG
jgi:hypothetical protein